MTCLDTLSPFSPFVAGAAVKTGRVYTLHLPYDGSRVTDVHAGDLDTLEAAIQAASACAPTMAEMTRSARYELLHRTHSILQRDAAEFSRLIALETGKPIREARTEVDRALQTLLHSALAALQLSGESVPMDAGPSGAGRIAVTVREPLGVIGAITPFNFPLNLTLHKVAPALAAGNTVVHKPSENTPLSAIRLAHAFHEAGAPSGAYNVTTGDGGEIGKAMVADPRIRMITFTGSAAVGKQIRSNAGLKRVSLELGGNCGAIIEPDADLALAVSRSVIGAFSNNGQSCVSVQRIYVHESIANEFMRDFRAAAQKLQVGHPLEETTDISSLISEEEAERVESWIADAVSKGAEQILGGTRKRATLPPTILAEVPGTSRMSCEEVFGPVVAVNRYTDLDAAIHEVNRTPYGLQAGIFTRDFQKAYAAARKLEAGGVMINDVPTFRVDHMPYGGVKESGMGREGPRYAIEEMTELKLICWRQN